MKDTANLVKMLDNGFVDVYLDWVDNIVYGVSNLHQNGSTAFAKSFRIYLPQQYSVVREDTVESNIKKMLRKYRNTDVETILVGYDTLYLQPAHLEAILCKISAKKFTKDVVLKQITAAKITRSVDEFLFFERPIPDLIFAVIQLC